MKASTLIISMIFAMGLGTVQAADEEKTVTETTPNILSGMTQDEVQSVNQDEMEETKGTGPWGGVPSCK